MLGDLTIDDRADQRRVVASRIVVGVGAAVVPARVAVSALDAVGRSQQQILAFGNGQPLRQRCGAKTLPEQLRRVAAVAVQQDYQRAFAAGRAVRLRQQIVAYPFRARQIDLVDRNRQSSRARQPTGSKQHGAQWRQWQ